MTLTEHIQQFTARYRSAVAWRAVIWSVLGAVVLFLLWWGLRQWSPDPRISLGVPAALAVSGLGAVLFWLKRRWISPQQSVASLDKTLGMQDRLVTLSEFAKVTPPPELYAQLEEDARRALDPERIPMPSAFDRTSLILALILLLLMVMPVRGRSPLQQLANLPKELQSKPQPQPQPPDQSTPPQPSPQSPQDQQQQDQQSGGQSKDQKPQGDQAKGGQNKEQDAQQDQQKEGSPQSQDGQQQAKSGESPQQQKEQSGNQQSGGSQQDKQAGQQQGQEQSKGQQGQEQSKGQQGQQSAEQQSGSQGKEPGAAQQQQAKQDQSQAGESQGGQGMQPSANQEALRAEIQQLLKEVSGELKEIQQQLADAQSQTPPNIGRDSDPNLYEDATTLDPLTGTPVPIAIKADTEESSKKRQGSGVGEAGEEVSEDAPAMAPEDAQLSDTPIEEKATDRQVVPPEYKDVFDRLNRPAESPQ